MSETAPRALPPGLTPVTEARHYGFLKASIPQYLVEAKPEHRAALKSTELSKSGWYGALTPASKGQLKPLLEARFTSQNRLDQHLSKVLPLEAFAQPLLDAALKAAGFPLPVKDVYLRLYTAVVDAFGVATGGYSVRTLSLLQAALHNFEQPETQADYFAEGSGFITPPDELGRFKPYITALKIESFTQLCRDLDIGAKYQEYLKPYLDPQEPVSQGVLELRNVTQQKAMLKLDAQIALLKGDIGPHEHALILRVIEGERHIKLGDKQLWYWTPCVMKILLHGCVVFALSEKYKYAQDFIVWIPGDPEHPLKWYAKFDDFRDELVRKLTAPGTVLKQTGLTPYQTFLSRFIQQSDRPQYYQNLTELVRDAPDQPWGQEWFRSESTQFWVRALAPIATLPVIVAPNPDTHKSRIQIAHPSIRVTATTLDGGSDWADLDLWNTLLNNMRTQAFANAQGMALPTAMADANNRSLRYSHYLNIGLFAVNLVSMVVPPLGEIMMVVMAGQLLYETFEGLVEWGEGDKQAALAHISDVLENMATLAVGAGVFHVAAPVIEKLKVVFMPDGSKRLWNADLSAYERSIAIPVNSRPDDAGLHTIKGQNVLLHEGKTYVLQRDSISGDYRAGHPHNPHAYKPVFKHTGQGVWVHEGEQPLTWDLPMLKRRLGSLSAEFSATEFDRILKVCDVQEDDLRRMYVEDEPLPGVLIDSVRQFRAYSRAMKAIEEVRAGPLSIELNSYSAAFTIELARWPQNIALELYDELLPKLKGTRFGSTQATGSSVIRISRKELMEGQLPARVIGALSESQIEGLLGERVALDTVERVRVFKERLAMHMEKEIHRLYSSLYGELVSDTDPANASIKLIKRLFPKLSTNLARQLVGEANPAERLLLKGDKLSARLHRIARQWQRQTRLSAAYLGGYLDGLITADTETLVLNTLGNLPGWKNDLRIEIRSVHFSGELTASFGDSDASDRKVLARISRGRYKAFDADGNDLHGVDDLYSSLQHALPNEHRKAIGLPHVGQGSELKLKLQQHALPRPSLRELLGMQVDNRPFFLPPERLSDGRLGYPLSGRGAAGAAPDANAVLKGRLQNLYPGLSDASLAEFLTAHRENAAARVRGLEEELAQLDSTLNQWINSTIDGQEPGADGALWDLQREVLKHRHWVRDHLKKAWRRVGARHVFNDRALGQLLVFDKPGLGPVLESLPPLVADFGHVTRVVMDHIGVTDGIDGFLSNFKKLRSLDITDCALTRLPPSIANMPRLGQLDLSFNDIELTPESVNQLSRLPRMLLMSLESNPVNLPPNISHMPHLKGLNLRNCEVSQWPTGFLAVPRPREFQMYLEHNPLTSIPEVAPGSDRANTLARAVVTYDDLPFDVLNTLKIYREAVGLDPERQFPPGLEASSLYWLRGLSPEMVESNQALWNRIELEHGSEPLFNIFKQQVASFKDRPLEVVRDMQNKVWRMLQAMDESPQLLDKIFRMASAPATCVDAGAQIFNALGVEVMLNEIYQLPQKWLVKLELFDLSRGKARLNQLGRIARARVSELLAEGRRFPQYDAAGNVVPNIRDGVLLKSIDEVEIYLKYTTDLKDELDLPWQIAHMIFAEDDVTAEMIDSAAIHVRALEAGTGLRDQLLELPMWTEFLERSNPDAFEAIKNKIDALIDLKEAQEELVEKGAALSEVQKEVLHKNIQKAADTATIKVVPGQVLSDEAYYAQLDVFDKEKTALMQSLTNEVVNIETDADEPKTGRADS